MSFKLPPIQASTSSKLPQTEKLNAPQDGSIPAAPDSQLKVSTASADTKIEKIKHEESIMRNTVRSVVDPR